jgi:hypothetical protein
VAVTDDSLNHLEIKKAGTASMGEDPDIESTVGPGHVSFADLAPIASVPAGEPGEASALALELEPARSFPVE